MNWILGILLFLTFMWGLGYKIMWKRSQESTLKKIQETNERWKLAAEVMVLKAVRDAFWTKSSWTNDDEKAFQDSIKTFKATGFSLETIGLREQDIVWPSCVPEGEEVH